MVVVCSVDNSTQNQAPLCSYVPLVG